MKWLRWLIIAALCSTAPASAFWQSRDSNYNISAAAGQPFGLTFVTNTSDLTAQTTYTFTSQAFGAVDPNRQIILAIFGRNPSVGSSVISATIGGVSAALAFAGATGDNGAGISEIWVASVPTGTSGTVTVTFSGSCLRAGISIYRLVGATAHATAGAGVTNANVPAQGVTITIPTGGATVAVSGSGVTATDGTTTNQTQDVHTLLATTLFQTANNTTGSGSTILTFTYNATQVAFANVAAAAFGP